jgi:hypothetical protein
MPEPFSATAPVKSLPGTAAKPGVTFTGDEDTGLYRSGTNELAVTVGGAEAAKFTATQTSLKGDINLDDGGSFQTTLQLVTPTAARTITFPDATGTVGLVAGSTGQLVFNNAGAYSGLSGVTTDGTDVTLTGRFISSLNGAASAPPGTFTGTWFTGGTATTTKPQVLIEPTGTTSTAWSTSGTGLGVNAASGFGGRLLDLQLNGTSNFNVDSTGRTSFPLGTAALPALYPGADTNTGMWSPAADTLAWSTDGVERTRIDSSGRLLVGTSTATANGGVLQVSNGITFPGTQSACSDPNTLDDYEEGTFTPTITFATPGDLSVTYARNIGQYTKTGNLVSISVTIQTSAFAHTTASGQVRIAGLPFTPNVTNLFSGNGLGEFRGITKSGYTHFGITWSVNQTYINVAASSSGSIDSLVAAADMPTSGTVKFAINASYPVA